MSTDDRMAMLHQVADTISARFDEFLEAECLDTETIAGIVGEVDRLVFLIKRPDMAARAEDLLADHR